MNTKKTYISPEMEINNFLIADNTNASFDDSVENFKSVAE